MYYSRQTAIAAELTNLAGFCKENPNSLPDVIFQMTAHFDTGGCLLAAKVLQESLQSLTICLSARVLTNLDGFCKENPNSLPDLVLQVYSLF
jgi:hypothetical protein